MISATVDIPVFDELTLFPLPVYRGVTHGGKGFPMDLRTDITTAARRVAREVNAHPAVTRLNFDANGVIVYAHEAEALDVPREPDVRATACGLKGTLERMTWRQAQDLLDAGAHASRVVPDAANKFRWTMAYGGYLSDLESARRRHAEEHGEGSR